MSLISGQPIGPDGLGGAFHNTLESRRGWVWRSLGGRQGIIDGLESANVPGQLQRTYSPGMALLEERDATGNLDATGRGYTVGFDPDDGDLTVAFAVPDASARVDAVVIAMCDTSVGSAGLGTAVSEVGPQIVVVKGVSGTTTPRTEAQINAAIGSGGWLRLDDVTISPGDSEVSDAAVARNPDAEANPDSGWISLGLAIGHTPWGSGTGADLQIRKTADGVVWYRGALQNNSGNAITSLTSIGVTVPAGFRPGTICRISTTQPSTADNCLLEVNPDGTLNASVGSGTTAFMYVSALTYLAEG